MRRENSNESRELVIIGGGPAGYAAAIKAGQQGADVLLVEKDKIGGTCLNRGCIPTKAFVKTAEVYKNMKNARQYGLEADNISCNMKKIKKRKDRIVKRLVKGVEYLLKENKIEVINGVGQLQNSNKVLIKSEEEEKIVSADNILLATGSEPALIPVPGVELPQVKNSTEILNLEKIPESMVVVGGGVIGMEFAFIFANLGVEVTVIEYLDSVLNNLDNDVSQELARAARRKKIEIHNSSEVKEFYEKDNNQLGVKFVKKGEEKEVETELALISTGRKPVLENLGVDKVGIELTVEGQGIAVDDRMATNVSGIYAAGDLTNIVLLAHVAFHQGIVAVENILGWESKMDYSSIPNAIFTDPEIATVGIGEEEAKRRGIKVQTAKFPLNANGKVLAMGNRRGFIKLIAREEDGVVLGGSIIGPSATELIVELTVAVQNKLSVEDLAETIHAHPTISEGIHEAALIYKGGGLHYNG